jgi:RecB family exonuclease
MSNPAGIHSFLSFSSRERWRACPGSVRLSKGLPDKGSPFAAEGTVAHAVKEAVMRDPEAHIDLAQFAVPEGLDLGAQTVAQWRNQLLIHARNYCDFVTSHVSGDLTPLILEEQRVAATSIHPALFGTADTIIWQASIGRLTVIDYKYGFKAVDVGTIEDTNPQLAAYGVAAAEKVHEAGQTVREIVLAVYQPRVPLRAPAQVLTIPNAQDWLAVERAKLRDEAEATEAPDAPLVPGDHCRYCKAAAAGLCPAVKQPVATALNVAAGAQALLDISVDELLNLYSARAAFKPFWEEVEERIKQLATMGHARLQVKETAGRQMWADPKSAAMTLLAIGRSDLVQPVALSDALPALPADVAATLVKRSKPSTTIKVVDAPAVKDVAKIFDKYARGA